VVAPQNLPQEKLRSWPRASVQVGQMILLLNYNGTNISLEGRKVVEDSDDDEDEAVEYVVLLPLVVTIKLIL
jgi:co-chaperonin GroES (HSP10)